MNKTTLLMTLAMAGAMMAQPGPGPGMRGGGGGGGGRGPGGMGPGMGMMMGGPGFMMHQLVTGAPYSAVQTNQFVERLADGNTITRTNSSKIYRDTKGRVRVEHTMTPPGSTTAVTRISIFDPVAGYSYQLDPAALTAVQRKMPAPPAETSSTATPRTPRAPAGATVNTEDLGTQTISGVAATGTRTTITIAANVMGNSAPIVSVREVWTSTALKIPVKITSTDPRFGNSTMQLNSLVQGEPDPSLFQVPSNYTLSTRSGPPGPRRHDE